MYSAIVKRLVADPPNRGKLESATHVGEVENPVCGDRIRLGLMVEDQVVRDARFTAEGCPAAIASAACLSELVKNRPLEECQEIRAEDLVSRLGGLPPHKLHGAELAVQALHRALGLAA